MTSEMGFWRNSLFLTAAAFVVGCGGGETPPSESDVAETETVLEEVDSVALLDSLTDEIWSWRLESDVYTRLRLGLPITEFADVTLEATEQNALIASDYLEKLEQINESDIDHDRNLTRLFLIDNLEASVRAVDDYLYSFLITPYIGGWAFMMPQQAITQAPLSTEEDRKNYLGLIDEYADLVEQIRTKTEMQAESGVLLPKPALASARGLVSANRNAAEALLTPADARLDEVNESTRSAFLAAIEVKISERVLPAFDSLTATIGEAYEAEAPETVGLSQYPGGPEAYLRAIKANTSYASTPEELHEFGKERMARTLAAMADIRDQLGFEGTQQEFHDMLRVNPRFVAQTPADVEERYNLYIDRIEPLVGDYFNKFPEAPYGVKRLDPAAEPGQTFGFYQPPTSAEPRGLYRYNGSKLESRSLIGAGALIYHELIPGHHFQIALQAENDSLHDIRKYSSSTAYAEGWAEYAADLGFEMGLYDDLYDHYGRLTLEVFLSSRLVVDTGLNALGWSLEDAREYMLANTMMSELEINSETLRYSTDMPGQALGYKTGHPKIAELRSKAEAALGDKFDIKAFHAAILEPGTLPLNVLEYHLEWFIEQSRAAQ